MSYHDIDFCHYVTSHDMMCSTSVHVSPVAEQTLGQQVTEEPCDRQVVHTGIAQDWECYGYSPAKALYFQNACLLQVDKPATGMLHRILMVACK